MKKFNGLNDSFTESMAQLWHDGSDVNSRGTNQKELLFHNMVIEDPTDLNLQVPARRFNPSYALIEWLWYLSKDKAVKNIGKLAGIWKQIADTKDEVESNYGYLIFGIKNSHTNQNQWEWVVDELLRDRDTRRATISINQSWHKGKNNADYPCTQSLHFFIRDNKLHLGVSMRSNDAVFGFCNDVFTFCMFQQLMLNELNTLIAKNGDIEKEKIELGHYYHSAGSFHVYEKHYTMCEKITNNYWQKCQQNSYPVLNKIKLKDNITYEWLKDNGAFLPIEDQTKEEMLTHAHKIKELIYEHS